MFFGWWTVLAGGFVSLWGMGYYSFGISALFKPIASELGFSRAVASIPAGIGRLEGGFEAPLAGWLTDKYGPRGVILFGVFVTGLGLILMYFINSLWAFIAVWGVIVGTGINIGMTVPLDKAIANWFVKRRGMAISLRWILTAFSGIMMLPLIGWLISAQGWRLTCVTGGLVMWLVGLPIVWFGVKSQRPEYYGLLPDGAAIEEGMKDTGQALERGARYAAEVEEVEFTLRQAMRTPAFWLLIAGFGSYSLIGPVVMTHGIPFLTDIGFDPVWAAVMMGLSVSATIPTRLFTGFVADRLKKSHLRFLLGGAFLLQAIGISAFLLNQTVAMAYVFFILYYSGLGPASPLNSIIRARYFGRKAFGSINGVSQLFIAPFGVIAPIYAGWIYDTTGSYTTAFALSAGLVAFGAVITWLTTPPKPPAEVTDLRKIV